MMFHWREGRLSRISINMRITGFTPGANPGFILGGGSYSFFSFFQNTSYIRKSTGHLREGGEGGAGVRTPCTLSLQTSRRAGVVPLIVINLVLMLVCVYTSHQGLYM